MSETQPETKPTPTPPAPEVSIPITPDASETEQEIETPDASISMSEEEEEEKPEAAKEEKQEKQEKEEEEKSEAAPEAAATAETLAEQDAEDSVARPKETETPLDTGSEGEVQLPNQKMAISPTSIESRQESGEQESGEQESGEQESGEQESGEQESGEQESGEQEGDDVVDASADSDSGSDLESSDGDGDGSSVGSSEGVEIYMGPDATEITLSMESVVKKLADEHADWQEASKFVKHIGNFQDELGQTHIGVALDFELMSTGELAMTTEKIILNLMQWMREMGEENMPMFVAGHSLPPPGVIRPSPLMAVVFVADSDITGASLFHARQRRGGAAEKHATMVVVSSRGLVSPIVLATAALSTKRGYQAVAITAPLGTVTFLHNIGFRAENRCAAEPPKPATESPEFNKTYEKMKEMLHMGGDAAHGSESERESDRVLIYCL